MGKEIKKISVEVFKGLAIVIHKKNADDAAAEYGVRVYAAAGGMCPGAHVCPGEAVYVHDFP